MKAHKALLVAILIAAGCHTTGHNFSQLAKAIDTDLRYPVWKLNDAEITKEYGFNLIFNDKNPGEITIPNFDRVLNGQSYTLLACHGKILPFGNNNGYVVGTAIEGPTFGKILILDDNFRKIIEIDSQKVVQIKLVALLSESTQEIVTWEDHRYGTNTTRRVLNVYKIYPDRTFKKIFEHNIFDATLPDNEEAYYRIDYDSLIQQKKIVVSVGSDRKIYSWNGQLYQKPKDCNC